MLSTISTRVVSSITVWYVEVFEENLILGILANYLFRRVPHFLD